MRLSIELARQAAVGLSVAHARSVVHRALKPEACALFARSGGSYLLKVGNFGIARLIAPAAASPAVYQAPEQRAGGEPDPSVDCYALGSILYEMIVGLPPLLTTILLLRTMRPNVSADLEALVERCLASTLLDRFCHISELAEALDDLVAAMGERLSVAAADETTVIERRSAADDATVAAHLFTPAPEDAMLIALVAPGAGEGATVIEEPVAPAAGEEATVIEEPVAPAAGKEATLIVPAASLAEGASASAVANANDALIADTVPDEALAVLPMPSVALQQQPSAGGDVAAEASSVVPPDEAVTILPEPVPAISTPLPWVSATRSLVIATPPLVSRRCPCPQSCLRCNCSIMLAPRCVCSV